MGSALDEIKDEFKKTIMISPIVDGMIFLTLAAISFLIRIKYPSKRESAYPFNFSVIVIGVMFLLLAYYSFFD